MNIDKGKISRDQCETSNAETSEQFREFILYHLFSDKVKFV